MDRFAFVMNILGYNLVLLELLVIAYMSWRYNGFASSGVRRYLGPFCLILAANLVRLDSALFELYGGAAWAARLLNWGPLTVAMTWSVVLICWFMIVHMREQLRVSRELVNRRYNGGAEEVTYDD